MKEKLTKKLIGKPVILSFLDHCANAQEVVKCQAIGWVKEINDIYVILRHWDIPEDNICDRESNSEFISIVKNTIYKVKILS